LFLDDVAGATQALSRADEITDPGFASEVSWYRAVADERAGRVDEARRRLDASCAGGDRRACNALSALRSRSTLH
jgi:hypothetical protein